MGSEVSNSFLEVAADEIKFDLDSIHFVRKDSWILEAMENMTVV